MNCEMPESYGGLGLSCLDHCLVQEEISYGCVGINTTLAANALGAMPLIIAGSEEQKKKYFGRLLAEPIFAPTAARSRTRARDVAGMKSRYRKVGRRLRPQRPEALDHQRRRRHFYTVFATAGRHRAAQGHPCFVVDRDTPGVSVGKKENKMGQRACNTTDVLFEEVKLTQEERWSAPEGEGFKVAMQTFDRTRPWIAAGAAGRHRAAASTSRGPTRSSARPSACPSPSTRRCSSCSPRWPSPTRPPACSATRRPGPSTTGEPDSIVSSYAKAYGADAAMRVATDAVQIFGGYGYTKEYPVEKLMRDAKLLQIYEGTCQIQRMVIARNILGGR